MQRGSSLFGSAATAPMDRSPGLPRWVERVYDMLLILIVGYVIYRLASVVINHIGIRRGRPCLLSAVC